MIDAFALALFDAFVDITHRMSPRMGEVAQHLRDAARPPPGVELRADALYTGIVVVDRNRPVLMLAIRVGDLRGDPDRRPVVSPSAEGRTPFFGGQRSLHLDPDDARWDYPDPYNTRR